jgi:hypothetical protein
MTRFVSRSYANNIVRSNHNRLRNEDENVHQLSTLMGDYFGHDSPKIPLLPTPAANATAPKVGSLQRMHKHIRIKA